MSTFFTRCKVEITEVHRFNGFRFKANGKMTKTFKDVSRGGIGFSNFGHWDLFDIWNFKQSLNIHQRKLSRNTKF